MFELVLTLCLLGDPKDCVERRVDAPAPMALEQCMQRGPAGSLAAAASLPERGLKGWRCSSRAGSLEALAAPADSKAAGTARGFEIEQVAEGVFVHTGAHDIPNAKNRGDLSNIGFVIGTEAVAVIDAGGSAHVAHAMLGSIRARTELPIKYLLITHMHPDHVLGAKVFVDAGAQMIGHRRLGRALAARAEGYETNLRRLMGDEAFEGSAVVTPDSGVEGEMRIDLGGRSLLLEAHPTAHTDNDLTILDEQTGTWFLGDLMFLEHTPALDGSLRGWLSLLERFNARDVARIVPGHGPASVPWPEGGEAINAYLSSLAEQTRAAINAGTTLHQATQEIGQDFADKWLLFDEFNARNVTAAFQELEWE